MRRTCTTPTTRPWTETSPLPVTIAVSAAVGFGRVATIRVGTSCGAALEDVRRDADASAPWDTLDGGTGGSGALPGSPSPPEPEPEARPAGSTPEGDFPPPETPKQKNRRERRAPRNRGAPCDASRDAERRPRRGGGHGRARSGAPPRDACEAATAAAAGGSGEGGPFQQAATLIRVATAGDVRALPAAWRLVRENCEGDTPPVLRGGARLNRIRVHEVVPPLTNHPLAPRSSRRLCPPPRPEARSPRSPRSSRGPSAPRWRRALRRRRRRSRGGATEETRASTRATRTRRRRRNQATACIRRRAGARRALLTKPCEDFPCRTWRRAPRRRCRRWCTSPVRRAGAGRVWGDANALAQTIASAAAACVGLLQRFPHGSLTRVGSDALFSRDVDKRTGGGGGGGDGIVLHCDFSPPLPKPAEEASRRASLRRRTRLRRVSPSAAPPPRRRRRRSRSPRARRWRTWGTPAPPWASPRGARCPWRRARWSAGASGR